MLILQLLCNIRSAIQVKYYELNIGPGRSVKGSRWEGSRRRTPGGSRLEKMATPGTWWKLLRTMSRLEMMASSEQCHNVCWSLWTEPRSCVIGDRPLHGDHWSALMSIAISRDQLSKSRPRVIGHLPYCDQFDPGLLLALREHRVTVVNLRDKH